MATFYGTTAAETLTGTTYADILYGLDGNDILHGLAGNDVLEGGTGADAMHGGLGNDVYYVNHLSDVVTELGRQGRDVVRSTITYTLSANVEKGILEGTGSISLTGNSGANTLTGNSAANTLSGGGGRDVLKGGEGADTLVGGVGNDRIHAGAGNDIIIFHAGDGSDIVSDLAAGDLVEVSGYSSAQSLTQVGSSVIALFATGNQITFSNSTVATVQSALRFEGAPVGDGTTISGTSGDDYLKGGASADIISALDGSDILIGYEGEDRLTGGSGSDTFVFTDLSRDTITDFVSGLDEIDLGWFVTDMGGATFQFIGAAAFTGQAGQGRQADGLFQVDLDGDGTADLILTIPNTLNAGDFVFGAIGYWDY